MSRQLDAKQEQRESLRQTELIKTLEFGLVGALEAQGLTFRGFSLRYEPFSCLLTLKVDAEGTWRVAHVGSDTIMNCFLKAQHDAYHHRLKWARDKYQPSEV